MQPNSVTLEQNSSVTVHLGLTSSTLQYKNNSVSLFPCLLHPSSILQDLSVSQLETLKENS